MRLRHLPLASQIILVISAFLLCVFLALTWGVLRLTEKSLVEETSRTLLQEAKVMAGTLDTFYGNVEERAERQLHLFLNWIGGPISPGMEMVRTELYADAADEPPPPTVLPRMYPAARSRMRA